MGEACGVEAADIADAEDITAFDGLIIGAPTWHTGADKERSGTSWDEFLYDTLPGLDLSGKKVGIFGLGDQESYSDNFCDAAGELYACFTAVGGEFVGLMCDEDNEYDKSSDRATAWIEQLKGE